MRLCRLTPASVDGGIPFLFHAGRSGPAATEQGCYCRNAQMPKFRILFLIALGLLLLAGISIAPSLGRGPVLAADGTELRRPDGSVVSKPDAEGYIRSNRFGFGAAALSMLFFVLAIVRVLWNLSLRVRRLRYEKEPESRHRPAPQAAGTVYAPSLSAAGGALMRHPPIGGRDGQNSRNPRP